MVVCCRGSPFQPAPCSPGQWDTLSERGPTDPLARWPQLRRHSPRSSEPQQKSAQTAWGKKTHYSGTTTLLCQGLLGWTGLLTPNISMLACKQYLRLTFWCLACYVQHLSMLVIYSSSCHVFIFTWYIWPWSTKSSIKVKLEHLECPLVLGRSMVQNSNCSVVLDRNLSELKIHLKERGEKVERWIFFSFQPWTHPQVGTGSWRTCR